MIQSIIPTGLAVIPAPPAIIPRSHIVTGTKLIAIGVPEIGHEIFPASDGPHARCVFYCGSTMLNTNPVPSLHRLHARKGKTKGKAIRSCGRLPINGAPNHEHLTILLVKQLTHQFPKGLPSKNVEKGIVESLGPWQIIRPDDNVRIQHNPSIHLQTSNHL